ncbi:hypothetical protein [Microbaculum marinum]|uniref:Prepilin-type N-terminal cleavage/methylation domain-containing protein n=1 Tax=Microbaculum marinum TaxID=1764581 RepID=A0AAW9S3X0_9HYPH
MTSSCSRASAARRARDRRGGYILFEALAALALSGLVLAAVPVASGLLIRNWEKATSSSDTLDRLSTGLSVVRRELSVLQRARWPGKRREDGAMAFRGDAETLGLILPAGAVRTAPGQHGGDRIVMFTAVNEEAGAKLMRGSIAYQPGTDGFEDIKLEDPVILLDGPWRYKFYYARDNKGQLEWLEFWESVEQLPLAIRLDVLNFATGIRVLPPMIVQLRVDGDAGCINEEAGPCGF